MGKPIVVLLLNEIYQKQTNKPMSKLLQSFLKTILEIVIDIRTFLHFKP